MQQSQKSKSKKEPTQKSKPKKEPRREWTFTTEELRIQRSHKAKCECKACMKVKNFYGRDLELEEIMSKYE